MARKHPDGLYVLFFTEMWERFGFYLMIALFSLYLNEKLHWSEADASRTFGTYNGLVYLTPFFGGIFADRIFGYRRAVITGAALLAAGYLLFAVGNMVAFYCSIGLLVLGNGLFKPNISTLVGNLYHQGDSRRDSAFSIFYMGINIGAGLAPLVGGYIRQKLGWGPAFATAGLGMMLSIAIFTAFRHHLTIADQRSSVSALLDVPLGPDYEDKADPPAVERQRIVALIVMCGIVMLFWLAFNQNGTSLTFWARDNTDRFVRLGSYSWEIAPEYYTAVNSIFIISLTPALVGLMGLLRRYNLEPSTPAKIGLGMLLTALAYMVMVVGSWAGGNTGKVSMLWLIGCYFLITIGELFVSPLGLSMVTKLAPRRMTAMLMGCWFISTAVGAKLSGQIGVFWGRWEHSKFFALLVLTSLFAAAILVWQFKRLLAAMPPEGPPETPPPVVRQAKAVPVVGGVSSSTA